MTADPGEQLRSLVDSSDVLVVPTAYDALSARVIEESGFTATHIGGFLGAGAILGVPDIGLFTATETLTRGANIADAIGIPVILDIDTGFGNAINVRRTIAETARAGIAGVHIEDQVFPKRCGQFGNGAMSIIDTDEMVAKIRAARDARGGDTLYLIARTDAIGAERGIDEALARMTAYAQAGADALLPITRSYEVLTEIGRRWQRPEPLVTAPTRFATVSAAELRDAGFRVVFYTEVAARAALFQVRQVLEELKKTGSVAAVETGLVPTEYLYEIVRLPQFRELEERYGALQGSART